MDRELSNVETRFIASLQIVAPLKINTGTFTYEMVHKALR